MPFDKSGLATSGLSSQRRGIHPKHIASSSSTQWIVDDATQPLSDLCFQFRACKPTLSFIFYSFRLNDLNHLVVSSFRLRARIKSAVFTFLSRFACSCWRKCSTADIPQIRYRFSCLSLSILSGSTLLIISWCHIPDFEDEKSSQD